MDHNRQVVGVRVCAGVFAHRLLWGRGRAREVVRMTVEGELGRGVSRLGLILAQAWFPALLMLSSHFLPFDPLPIPSDAPFL